MIKLSKYINYILYLIFAITFVYVVMFYFGEWNEDSAYPHPVYTDVFLNWANILLWFTIGITLVFEIFHIVMNPKGAVRTFISGGIILVIVFIAYSLSDNAIMEIVGYNGTDNVPSMLTMAGTILYTAYILFGVAVAVILYAQLSRFFK